MRVRHIGDVKKLMFTFAAMQRTDPFVFEDVVANDIRDAVMWGASKSAQEIMDYRESVVAQLEEKAKALWCALGF